jgi:hypothetical protein
MDWATPIPRIAANVTVTAGICRLKSKAEWTPTITVAATPARG